jgi:hypothetical protein
MSVVRTCFQQRRSGSTWHTAHSGSCPWAGSPFAWWLPGPCGLYRGWRGGGLPAPPPVWAQADRGFSPRVAGESRQIGLLPEAAVRGVHVHHGVRVRQRDLPSGADIDGPLLLAGGAVRPRVFPACSAPGGGVQVLLVSLLFKFFVRRLEHVQGGRERRCSWSRGPARRRA